LLHAWVLTRLPEALGRALENACRKLLSEVELLLPPNALTRLSKLLCSEASAELVLLVVLVELEVLVLLESELLDPDSSEIRLCRSLDIWPGPPPPGGGPGGGLPLTLL
jgi:hypothetical protein